jgi:hypothetical protein
MPESLTTLGPELHVIIFKFLDHIGTATQLSQTCRRLYSVWLANRCSICKALPPTCHPLLCEFQQPTWNPLNPREPPPMVRNVSLWKDALKLERALAGKQTHCLSQLHFLQLRLLAERREDEEKLEKEDSFVTARRILTTAYTVRHAARVVYSHLDEYCNDTVRFASRPCKAHDAWKRYGEYVIAQFFYKILIRIHRNEKIFTGCLEDVGPQSLCELVVDDDYQLESGWRFPNMSALRVGSGGIPKHLIKSNLVMMIENEYDGLTGNFLWACLGFGMA